VHIALAVARHDCLTRATVGMELVSVSESADASSNRVVVCLPRCVAFFWHYLVKS